MTHLPFIAAAYAIAIGVPLWLVIDAALRTRASGRRLDAIDPRRAQGAPDPRGAQGAPDPRGAQGAPDPRGAQGAPDPRRTRGAP